MIFDFWQVGRSQLRSVDAVGRRILPSNASPLATLGIAQHSPIKA
jgi:hypothetical protein